MSTHIYEQLGVNLSTGSLELVMMQLTDETKLQLLQNATRPSHPHPQEDSLKPLLTREQLAEPCCFGAKRQPAADCTDAVRIGCKHVASLRVQLCCLDKARLQVVAHQLPHLQAVVGGLLRAKREHQQDKQGTHGRGRMGGVGGVERLARAAVEASACCSAACVYATKHVCQQLHSCFISVAWLD